MIDEERGTPPAPGFQPVEAVLGVITAPVPTMRAIAGARPWLPAVVLYALTTLLSTLSALTAPPQPIEPSGLPQLDAMLEAMVAATRSPLTVVLGTMLSPLVLLIGTGITYLAARLVGGRGAFAGLLATQAYSTVPTLLAAPLQALLGLAGDSAAAVAGLVGAAAGLWALVLGVIGLREAMQLSTGRAIVALAITVCAVIVIGLVVAVIVAVMVAIVAAGWSASSLPPTAGAILAPPAGVGLAAWGGR